MRTESDLIVAVLALLRRDVIALPINYAVAVRRSDAEAAQAIMQAERGIGQARIFRSKFRPRINSRSLLE